MEFDRIILCTEAPKETGLAYHYYRAFTDILPLKKIVIIDESSRKYYDETSFLSKVVRKIMYVSGQSSKDKMNRVLENCSAVKKNIVIVFNTANLKYVEIKKLAQDPSIYLIHLLSDNPAGMNPVSRRLTIESLPLFDLICIFAKPLVPVLYQWGAKRVERIPFAYCKYTHFISAKAEEAEFPQSVYYFGTWTPDIEKLLLPLKQFDLHIEGKLWEAATDKVLKDIGTKGSPALHNKMTIMARKAGVVVNFTRASHGCFHTMKTFELTAAGACVVSNYSDEQAEFYKPDDSMVYFNTPGEMVEIVRSLLNDQEKNYKVRQRAIEASVLHSYHQRAAQLLNLIN